MVLACVCKCVCAGGGGTVLWMIVCDCVFVQTADRVDESEWIRDPPGSALVNYSSAG